MKICLISCHSFLNPGGVKRHILGLQQEFKKRGIYCKIIAPRRSAKENYGKDVILLGTSFPLPFSGGQADLGVNFNPAAITKTLEKEKFDVLHFHNFGFPSIMQFLDRSEVLNILTFHANPDGSELLKNFPFILTAIQSIANWKIHGIIGVASLNVKVFKKYRGPKIVIPNGIDLQEFNPRFPKIKRFLDNKINLLFVGRFEKRKGLIYLLRAYKILQKKYDNLRLIVVGEGELKDRCQSYVQKNKLKEVHFVGSKSGEELISCYNTCDIFVSPAIFGESFGLVLLEAMACQKPVVAFANRGYKELLCDKKGALLAKNKNPRDLAQKIERLVRSEKLRKKMGRIALKEAKEYSWDKVAGRILKFYRFCQKEKEKKAAGRLAKNNFSLEEILKKIEKVLGFKIF